MKRQLVFIHGGETFGTYNEYLACLAEWAFDPFRDLVKRWKHTLPEQLGEEWQMIAPSMPNKLNAKYVEWKLWFDKVVPHMQDGVVLVGHSLGGLFLAKYLCENKLPVQIGALILIAAPYNDADLEHSLADFVLPASLEGLRDIKVILYHSIDDPVVPFGELTKYQAHLPHATVRMFENRGHFLQEEFPELVDELKGL